MGNLTLDGVPVSISHLSQWPLRAASCDCLLKVTSSNKSEALKAFRTAGELGKFSGLHLSGVRDLSFLREFPLLLYLQITDLERTDTPQLSCLTNLRGLHLESPGHGIDFSDFPRLEIFSGDWHKDNHNLAACRDLRRLHVWHFHPRRPDLAVFSNMIRLEELNIAQTNITRLSGVETLEDLRFLNIAYAPKLASLDAIESPGLQVREIDLERVPKIKSYRPIASPSHLRLLRLSECAAMPNLKWMRGMNRLDFFSFVNTDVVDGNLTPLLDLPALRYVGTMDRRHYNVKCERLNQLLSQRNA